MRNMKAKPFSHTENYDELLPPKPISPPAWEIQPPRRYEEVVGLSENPEWAFPVPTPSQGRAGWKRVKGAGGRWSSDTWAAPFPLVDERHIINQHNLGSQFSDSNRNNPFAASFLSRKICRPWQCGGGSLCYVTAHGTGCFRRGIVEAAAGTTPRLWGKEGGREASTEASTEGYG